MVSRVIMEIHLFDSFVAGKMLAAKIKGIEKKALPKYRSESTWWISELTDDHKQVEE